MADIRNVVFLSHTGAGKTTLAEAMLFVSKTIPRMGSVDEGNTVSSFEPEEIKRKLSINLSILPFFWDGVKINLLDVPGYADFYGEVMAGIRVVEGAVLLVCAASGVEVGTEQVWSFVQEANLPAIIFINKMDREDADFEKVLSEIRQKLSPKAIPLQLPFKSQTGFKGVIELIPKKVYQEGNEMDVPEELVSQALDWREKLIETIVETDEELIERYLSGEEIEVERLDGAIGKAVKGRQIFPVLIGSAISCIGVDRLISAIVRYLPAPQVSAEPLSALVFKSVIDPYVGKLSYVRVYSGEILPNSEVWNPNRGVVERIRQIFYVRGNSMEPADKIGSGDMGALPKLSATSTNDTLCSKENPIILQPISFPQPMLTMSLYPKSKEDLDKMGMALPKLIEEDPSLHLHREPDTGETLLSGMGDVHLEVAAERLSRKFGVEAELRTPKVPYKETISVPVKTEYRHKKQTGGHGQFAHVFLELEPLPRGSGIQFVDRIVGGVISKNYIPAVEKGVLEASREGVLAGFPVTDVKATLYDGKEHPVDSSDICFKIAGAYAFKRGLEQGKPLLLEPIMKLRVKVPENLTGDIIGDLNTKRGRVMGMTHEGGWALIEALVPQAEVLRYAVDLRSLTQGRGSFTIQFSHYEEVPPHIAQKIIQERKSSKL